jgi:hypothetical protein
MPRRDFAPLPPDFAERKRKRLADWQAEDSKLALQMQALQTARDALRQARGVSRSPGRPIGSTGVKRKTIGISIDPAQLRWLYATWPGLGASHLVRNAIKMAQDSHEQAASTTWIDDGEPT